MSKNKGANRGPLFEINPIFFMLRWINMLEYSSDNGVDLHYRLMNIFSDDEGYMLPTIIIENPH